MKENKTINKVCKACKNKCKQPGNIKLIKCPFYVEDRRK